MSYDNAGNILSGVLHMIYNRDPYINEFITFVGQDFVFDRD